MLKVVELIETGACGRQQDDIPCNGPGSRPIYGAIDGARLHQGQSFQLRCDLRRGSADQHHGFRLLPELFSQYRVITVFIFTTEDDPEISWKGVNCLFCRVYVRCFRIIVVPDTLVLANELKTMLDSGNIRSAEAMAASACSCQSRCQRCRHRVLDIVNASYGKIICPQKWGLLDEDCRSIEPDL